MKSRRTMFVATLVSVALLGFALGASPAAAISTSSLYSKLKALQQQVTALAYKVSHIPAGPKGATGAAGPVGPQGSIGATGPAGLQGSEGATGPVGPRGPKGDTAPAIDEGFWPVSDIEVGFAPEAVANSDHNWWIGGNMVCTATVTVAGQAPHSYRCNVDHGVVRCTFQGVTKWSDTKGYFEFGEDGTWPPPTEGTPLEVEYWVDYLGVKKHGTLTYADWTYSHNF